MTIALWYDSIARKPSPAPARPAAMPDTAHTRPDMPVLLHEEPHGARLPPGSVPHQPSLLGALLGANSPAERQHGVRTLLRAQGFESLGYWRVLQLGDALTPVSFCTTYADRAWAQHYFARAYHQIDPRPSLALRSSLPTVWGLEQLAAQVPGHRQGQRLRRFVSELGATGMRSGVVFALPPDGNAQRSLMSLMSETPDTRWIDDKVIGQVLTLSLCLHEFYTRYSRSPEPAPARSPELSAVQREILECVSLGLGDKEIASRLGFTLHNVDYHLRQLRRRFGARNRVQLMHAAQGMETNGAP